MPDLRHMLRDADLDFLERIARLWGIELPSSSFPEALEVLTASLNQRELALEVIQAMPAEAQSAWQLILKTGRVPASQFTRQYGELRIQGEGWRKREEPDLHPVSVTEILWYRGLIGKGFFGKVGEPQEYLYVPDEWVNFFGEQDAKTSALEIRPASAADHAVITPAGGNLIDRLATLLAELRKNPLYPPLLAETLPVRLAFEQALLESAGMVLPGNQVAPEKSREILEREAGASLLFYFDLWQKSEKINDLRMLPGLIFEGTWSNPVGNPRRLLIEALRDLREDTWWSLPSLIAEIKLRQPDFQRAAGEYESWFIRRKSDNQYLHGFDAWDDVEGYLLRYLINGPLHWLGVLDLGSTGRGKAAVSFRISSMAKYLFSGQAPILKTTPAGAVKTTSSGFVHLPAGIQAALHYQIARFCQLQKETASEVAYCITTDSLKNAIDQGLKPTQLNILLKRAGVVNIPPGFSQLLERYEKFGVEASMERATLLTSERPELLETIFKDPRAAKYLERMISPQVASIKPGSEEALLKLLRELGRLVEVHLDV